MLRIEILTNDPKMSEVCAKYWEHDHKPALVNNADQLAKEYGFSAFHNMAPAVQASCKVYVGDWVCGKCGTPYTISNRTDFKACRKYLLDPDHEVETYLCPKCSDEEDKRLRILRDRASGKPVSQLCDKYNLEHRSPVDLERVWDNRLLFYLCCLLKTGTCEEVPSRIDPICDIELRNGVNYFPSPAYYSFTSQFSINSMINDLMAANLLFVHPDNSSIFFTANKKLVKADRYTEILFAPPVSSKNPEVLITLQILEETLHKMFLENKWGSTLLDDSCRQWIDIVLDECMELLVCLLSNKKAWGYDEKHDIINARNSFRSAIEHFSAGQIFHLIYRAVDKATFNISDYRYVPYSAVEAFDGLVDRALLEVWDIAPADRSVDCPQSVFSKVFFEDVLQLGDDAYTIVPSTAAIRKARKIT